MWWCNEHKFFSLEAPHLGPLRHVHEQSQVEHDRRGEDAVAAEEVHLDLHLPARPAGRALKGVPCFMH